MIKRKALAVGKVARLVMMSSNKSMIIQLITSRNNSKICVENIDEGQVLKEVTTNTKIEIWEGIRATDVDVVEVDLKK